MSDRGSSSGSLMGTIVHNLAAAATVAAVGGLYLWLLDPMNRKEENRAIARATQHWDTYFRSRGRKIPKMTYHEQLLLKDLVNPDDIGVRFSDIGGLKDQVRDIQELVLLPLQRPELFAKSKLVSRPTGVLLYGPPGTGKTMLARAVARESGAMFINANISSLLDKYLGESNKIVSALFSLAAKLSPCVVFLDEMDGLLGTRMNAENAPLTTIKTQFMSLMDGLHSNDDSQRWVLFLGASNRPEVIDPAILRRMPHSIKIGLPDARGREGILKCLLRSEHVDPEIRYRIVAQRTEGFSGSDLKELCKEAVRIPIREFLASELKMSEATDDDIDADSDTSSPPPLTSSPLLLAPDPTPMSARSTSSGAAAHRGEFDTSLGSPPLRLRSPPLRSSPLRIGIAPTALESEPSPAISGTTASVIGGGGGSGSALETVSPPSPTRGEASLRPITTSDLLNALMYVRPSYGRGDW